jgi:acetyl-CoA carboxylase carboxyl transferase subunit beta
MAKPPKNPPPKAEAPKKEPAKEAPKTAPPADKQRQGWFSRFAPGVRRMEPAKRETPDNLWVKCPGTGEMVYRPELEAMQWVTPSGHHMRIGPKLRFAYTFDAGRHEIIAAPKAADDPLHFSDDKPYRDRLASARKATGEDDAMAMAAGSIGGVPSVALVQDFSFMAGSLSLAVGEAFITAAQEAVKRGAPLVAFIAGGGVRMQEGALGLMQMARTTIALQELKAARLPYIVVLTDPTTGGITASYAMLGDVHLAEPKSMISFAGPRVIEQTIRETLPEGFQRAEFLEEKGMVDRVVSRKELPAVIGSILQALMSGRQRRLAAE